MTVSRRELLKQAGALAVWSAAGCSTSCVVRSPSAELAGYDAMGLAARVRQGAITPLELLEDVLQRVERVNPALNAVLTDLLDLRAARKRCSGLLGDGPLAGVPVMLKNLIEYRGATIDSGSRLYARALEQKVVPLGESSLLAAALENAGMVVAGITNSPEMGLIDTTEPALHGPTRNPWNLAYSAGGSSGGSAAAVAAGIVPLAHGNDGAGSIRIPASHCGVFGLKPSRGREAGAASVTAALNISSDLCLSRSVRDTAAFLSVVENRDDPVLSPVGFVSAPSGRRLEIALMLESFHGEPAHPEVERAVRSAAELCQALGHEVTEVALPIAGAAFRDAFLGLWATTTLRLEPLVEEWLGPGTRPEDVLEPWTLGLMALAKARGADASVLKAYQAFTLASAQMEALIRDYDVMLSPVVRVPPFPLGYHDPAGEFETILERFLDAVAYTPLQNATGMPGMSVPLHWTADGMPVGSHFSAWRGGERTLIELAYQLEEARPWSNRIPPVAVR